MSINITSTYPNTRSRGWYSKVTEYVHRKNRIDPGRIEIPGSEFFQLNSHRVLRIIRPELKSARFYEPQVNNDRPESLNDNFYSRWARRPHPSGNCRCSFRQSANSSRLSSHEEKFISKEIARIRSSLCEAEKNGKDIEELEKSIVVDLKQLDEPKDEIDSRDATRVALQEHCSLQTRIELLDDQIKKRIVQDLDRYISDLLDEILDDTIKAIAQTDNPFGNNNNNNNNKGNKDGRPVSMFDISFAFHENQKDNGSQANEDKPDESEKGYVNQGFVGSTSDPETLNFHLRHTLKNDGILPNPDCVDSGINSVETIELQQDQDQNLEQSLIDIIDAKLGGTSIGKSLEDLGMEIDETDESRMSKQLETKIPDDSIIESKEPKSICYSKIEVGNHKSSEFKRITHKEVPENPPITERTSKSLDEVIEESQFNSLRLEFKRKKANTTVNNNKSPQKEISEKVSSNVTSRVNKTVSVIRQRLVMRLGNPRRKCLPKLPSVKSTSNGLKSSTTGMRLSFELEDYRRRFPNPEIIKNHENDIGSEVILRSRHRKPTIVFLHGFGSSAECFEPQLQYFSALGYPCIAPDLLGHGMSSVPTKVNEYRFNRLLKDLETILQYYAFKPGQKCVIVAHNYGCSFATALASKYSVYIHQLVLISGGGPTSLAPPAREGPGHCCLRACLAPFLFCGMQRAVLYSARGRQHPYCGYETSEHQRPFQMKYVLRGMSWPDGDYCFHRRICTPTLLVHGLRDTKVSLVQECQMERTMIKAFLEAIPAAGHMPMTDCPEQLNHMIHCFIDLWKNKKW